MSDPIESIRLSPLQLALLEHAVETPGAEILVQRARKTAALGLAGKGLGTVSDAIAGMHYFKINEDGRDQLRIRA